MEDKELEDNYNDFWKGIVENEDGTLNKEQVKKELFDYYMVIDNCSKAFMEMTNGLISKPNTKFFEVLSIFRDKYLDVEITKDDIKELLDNIDDIQELKRELQDYFEIPEDEG